MDDIINTTIEVSRDEAKKIIEKREQRGLFYLRDKDEKGDLFIGIDNSIGEAYVEEFRGLDSCIEWLDGGGVVLESTTDKVDTMWEFKKAIERLGYDMELKRTADFNIKRSGEEILLMDNWEGMYPPQKKHEARILLDIFKELQIATAAYNEAEPVKVANVAEMGYRQLNKFYNIVLAAKYIPEYGYKFVTWEYDNNYKGFSFGHYFEDNFTKAKEDFAKRSGLIDEAKIFNHKELKALKNVLETLYESDACEMDMTDTISTLIVRVDNQLNIGTENARKDQGIER
jgi:hypothetical protein